MCRYTDEYQRTSSHRVRSSDDMQMAFTYFYWIIHAPRDFSLDELWTDFLDSNNDG
jgi:UDP-N-acetylglucosamine-lysosomal-enzyme